MSPSGAKRGDGEPKARRLGRYEVLSELGRGGMGQVLRARAPDGREVAIKILLRGRLASDSGRFERERRLQGELGLADGFVPLLDSGDSEEGPFVVMPLLGGGTLRPRLERGLFSIEGTIALGVTLARALGQAHARGVVHRDLKPENILYESTRSAAHGWSESAAAQGGSDRPLIADLGLAKHFDKEAPGASRSVELSKTGELRGTAGYMAPEQLDDAKNAGPPADVFALGAILYECLAGRPAFVGETVSELFLHVKVGRIEPLAGLRRDAPRWLVREVERALSPSPADRHPDGAALARALEDGAAGRSSGPLGRRGLLWLALLALGLGLGLGFALVLTKHRARASGALGAGSPTPSPVAPPSPSPRSASPTPGAPVKVRAQLASSWGSSTFVHPLGVRVAAFLEDGGHALTGGHDGTIRLWDLATGEDVRVFVGHEGEVYGVAPLPGGRRAVSCSADHTIRVWDLETGRELARFATGSEGRALALSSDGQRVFVGQVDGAIAQMALADGAVLGTWKAHLGQVQALALSPRGDRLASSGVDGLVCLWSVEGPVVSPVASLAGHQTDIFGLAFMRRGELLVSGGGDHMLRLWDVATGRELQQLGNNDEIDSIVPLPDGSGFFTGGRDRVIRRWSMTERGVVSSIELAIGRIHALCLSPDGKRLLFGDEMGLVRSFALDGTDVRPPRVVGHAGPVSAIACSPDADRIATGGGDWSVRLWSVARGAETARFTGQLGTIFGVAFSADGKLLASACWDHAIRIHDLVTGASIGPLLGHDGPVSAVAFTLDGSRLLSGGADHELRLWDLALGTATVVGGRALDTPINAIAISPDGRRALSGADGGSVVLWDLARGWPAASPMSVHGHTRGVAFLAGGREALALGADGQARTWDAVTGKALRTIGGDQRPARSLAAFPDGRRFLTASEDGVVRLWDSKTGEELLRIDLAERRDVPVSLGCAGDGRTFFVGTARGLVLRYVLEGP